MCGRGHLTCLWVGRSTFSYACPVPLDQEYGGLQGPDIRSCSPRGLWCCRLVLTAHICQILFFFTWTLPKVPKCSRSSAAHLISHRTGTRRYGGVVLTFPISLSLSLSLTQWSSLERERPVTTVTPVRWRGNERCVPGHMSFVPVGDLLRL